jgi:predicted RNase H-like HicB family nuclease
VAVPSQVQLPASKAGLLFLFSLCSDSIVSHGEAAESGGADRCTGTQDEARGIVPLTIEVEQEEDGRWLAEVPDLPGVLSYGQTRQEAIERVQVLALRVLADRLDQGEHVPQMSGVFAVTP